MSLKMPQEIPTQITYRCRQCLQDIVFPLIISTPGKFPIILQNIHGTPAHKLIISVNKFYTVESFELKALEQEAHKASSFSRDTLSGIGLSGNEIDLYFSTSGKGPISLNELALRAGMGKDETKAMAERFVALGLFKAAAAENYEAIPPYTAIISQLEKFGQFISNVKDTTPKQLQASFQAFEEKAAGIEKMHDFLKYLDKNVSGLVAFRDQSVGLVENAYKTLESQFTNLHTRIAENLEKLRLGMMMKTVSDVVERTIKNELEAIKQGQSQFIKSIIALSNNAGSIGTALKKEFDSVFGLLTKTFGDLRDTFASKVVVTLDDVLGQILDRLKTSNMTVKEFWEEAKKGVIVQMKDVWFIRSPEGMRAHINDMVSRCKMRVMVIAPTLLDIDIQPFLKAPKFINIRICTFIDPQNPAHIKILDQFDEHPNIAYRHRDLQNLWGINKDYEETITGIASRETVGTEQVLQVVAIGSGIQEHIKIFVPVLEEAWMNSKKEVPGLGFRAKRVIETGSEISKFPQPGAAAVPGAKPGSGFAKFPKPTPSPAPVAPSASLYAPSPMPATSMSLAPEIPAPGGMPPSPLPTQSVAPTELTNSKMDAAAVLSMYGHAPTPGHKRSSAFSSFPKTEEPPKPVSDAVSVSGKTGIGSEIALPPPTDKQIGSNSYDKVLAQLDAVATKLMNSDGGGLTIDFDNLGDFIKKEIKFSMILKDIKMWADSLRHNPAIDEKKKGMIEKRIKDWREKLDEERKKHQEAKA